MIAKFSDNKKYFRQREHIFVATFCYDGNIFYVLKVTTGVSFVFVGWGGFAFLMFVGFYFSICFSSTCIAF